METLQVYQSLKNKVRFICEKLKLFKYENTTGRKLKISIFGERKFFMNVPDEQFYDKVATKFGGYKGGVIRTEKFFDGDPEKIFLEQLLNRVGNDKMALDIGCADGRFTLKVAPNFKQIVAIDVSEQMLGAAKKLQNENLPPKKNPEVGRLVFTTGQA